jgi:hypothetical protein
MPRSKNWKPIPPIDKIRRRVPAVDTVGPDECLIWSGAKASIDPMHDGYGHMGGPNGSTVSVPRVVLENKLGRPIKPGMRALHTCDNRPCFNPHHLYEGTAKRNSRDMVERGRSTTGEKQPNAKLTDDQVRAIRADTRSQRAIAAEYKITQPAVSMIKARKRWAHVV